MISYLQQISERTRTWRKRLLLLCLTGVIACAEAPQKVSSMPAFRDTMRLETHLKKGISTVADVKQFLGEPTGNGALYMPRLKEQPYDVLFYQDIELTDIKGSKGQLDLQLRQQILVVYVRGGVYEGFTWFSNAESATGWIRDSLQGVGR